MSDKEKEKEPLKGSEKAEPEKWLADGMPDIAGKEPEPTSLLWTVLGSPFSPVPINKFLTPFVIIAVAIAFAIHAFGSTAKYDAKLDDADQGFYFLGALVFSRMVMHLNFYPMVFKAQIMSGKAGNLRTNMAIYKALKDGKPDGAAIVMDAEGAAGQYNRANRSLSHFTETAPGIMVTVAAAGPVFPFPVFILVCLYALGRALHQRGEATGCKCRAAPSLRPLPKPQKKLCADGSHGPGFAIAMVVGFVLEGLCVVAALKCFGVSAAWLGMGD